MQNLAEKSYLTNLQYLRSRVLNLKKEIVSCDILLYLQHNWKAKIYSPSWQKSEQIQKKTAVW